MSQGADEETFRRRLADYSEILDLPVKDCSYPSLTLRDWEKVMETLSGKMLIVLE